MREHGGGGGGGGDIGGDDGSASGSGGIVVVVIVVVVDAGTVFIKKQSLFGDYRIQSHPVVSIRVSPKVEHYQRASTNVHCIQHINRGPYSCTCRNCTYICPHICTQRAHTSPCIIIVYP